MALEEQAQSLDIASGTCCPTADFPFDPAGSLQLAWNYGGPAACIYGWLIVSFASVCVGLSMGEIVSSLPSCGGPYVWSCVLAGRHGPFIGWVTGMAALLVLCDSTPVFCCSHSVQLAFGSIFSYQAWAIASWACCRGTISVGLLCSAGWFNLLGEVSIVAAAAAAIVTLIASLLPLSFDLALTQPQQLGIYTGSGWRYQKL